MRITENQEVMVNFLGANLTKIVKHSNDSSETVTKCLSVFGNLFGLEFKRLKYLQQLLLTINKEKNQINRLNVFQVSNKNQRAILVF